MRSVASTTSASPASSPCPTAAIRSSSISTSPPKRSPSCGSMLRTWPPRSSTRLGTTVPPFVRTAAPVQAALNCVSRDSYHLARDGARRFGESCDRPNRAAVQLTETARRVYRWRPWRAREPSSSSVARPASGCGSPRRTRRAERDVVITGRDISRCGEIAAAVAGAGEVHAVRARPRRARDDRGGARARGPGRSPRARGDRARPEHASPSTTSRGRSGSSR